MGGMRKGKGTWDPEFFSGFLFCVFSLSHSSFNFWSSPCIMFFPFPPPTMGLLFLIFILPLHAISLSPPLTKSNHYHNYHHKHQPPKFLTHHQPSQFRPSTTPASHQWSNPFFYFSLDLIPSFSSPNSRPTHQHHHQPHHKSLTPKTTTKNHCSSAALAPDFPNPSHEL